MINRVIHFNDECLEAIALYEKAFRVTEKHVYLYKDAVRDKNADAVEGKMNHVMHSSLMIYDTKFNMSDVGSEREVGNMIKFNVFTTSEDEFYTSVTVLKEEGAIVDAPGKQFFAELFAVVVDKYGVRWQIMYNG